MVLTAGKIIKIRTVLPNYEFVRCCDTPGRVDIKGDSGNFSLPGNKNDAMTFIKAYWRVVNEHIGYSESGSEPDPDMSELGLPTNIPRYYPGIKPPYYMIVKE